MTMSTTSRWRQIRHTLRHVLALALPYFQSMPSSPPHRSDRWEPWRRRGLLAAIVTLNLASVYMLVLINDWNRVFYDALQDKNQAVFWHELGRFTYLAFGFIAIAVYKFYLTQLLELRWRTWMTQQFMHRWLTAPTHYHLELLRFAHTAGVAPSPDNPDQRIAEDVNLFTSYTVGLAMGLLNAVVTLVSFVGILWGLSGPFTLAWQGQDWVIPGFMVWMAVLYCAVGSWLTHHIGRPLTALNVEQQRREAHFRHHLVRVREYSESIAFDQGEEVERQRLGRRFSTVIDNALLLIHAQKRLIWFTSGFGQAAVVFPFVVAAPRFFSGAIQLGELMQIASAFGRVQDALSWFVDNYASLAAWQATTNRLTDFDARLSSPSMDMGTALSNHPQHDNTPHTPNHQAKPPASDVPKHTNPSASAQWQAHALRVCLPDGRALGLPSEWVIRPGDRICIQGASGSGKSTLLRALSGLWPWTHGHLHPPNDHPQHTLFVPQRPYMPHGPLREALAYPDPTDRYTDAQLHAALTQACLPQWRTQLDAEDAWNQTLSGGEQQRLALARVFLKQPRWLFLDEATSALDAPTERLVYERLLDMVALQDGAVVSVAHRPQVAALHTDIWQVASTATF